MLIRLNGENVEMAFEAAVSAIRTRGAKPVHPEQFLGIMHGVPVTVDATPAVMALPVPLTRVDASEPVIRPAAFTDTAPAPKPSDKERSGRRR